MKQVPTGLTYDDVLLEPHQSPVRSQKEMNTSSWFTRHIPLSIAIVSSNIDTVTRLPWR